MFHISFALISLNSVTPTSDILIYLSTDVQYTSSLMDVPWKQTLLILAARNLSAIQNKWHPQQLPLLPNPNQGRSLSQLHPLPLTRCQCPRLWTMDQDQMEDVSREISFELFLPCVSLTLHILYFIRGLGKNLSDENIWIKNIEKAFMLKCKSALQALVFRTAWIGVAIPCASETHGFLVWTKAKSVNYDIWMNRHVLVNLQLPSMFFFTCSTKCF